jgi:hypothetical protein
MLQPHASAAPCALCIVQQRKIRQSGTINALSEYLQELRRENLGRGHCKDPASSMPHKSSHLVVDNVIEGFSRRA